MKKILLAPNSLKECADSTEVAGILEKTLSKEKDFDIRKLPVSDGGDGFLNVCSELFKLKLISYNVITPYGEEEIAAKVGYSEELKTVFIESAEVIGLKKIAVEKRHPLLLNTKGLAELVQQVLESDLNVEKIIIGVGGTGTSDLGLGFCSVFGLKLFDLFDKEVEIIPGNYFSVKNYEWSGFKFPFSIELVTDVDNSLLGDEGAIKTFASQKGATKGEIDILEIGFTKIIKLLKNNRLVDSVEKLSGAGGGLAAGLEIFFNAKIIKAKDFIQGLLLRKVDDFTPDFVITGEGAFDRQSLMNKGANVIIEYFSSKKIPVFLICGKIDKEAVKKFGSDVIPIELSSFFNDETESIRNYEKGLELAAEKIKSYIFA